MSDLSFKPYQHAYDAYTKDIEQLTGIGDRLVASAKGVKGERIKDTEKLEKLKTIQAQTEKLPQAVNGARNRFDAAIDAADAAFVEKTRWLCSYAVSIGRADAGMRYLPEECRAYDRARGDFKLRRALYAQIVDVSASVADAAEGKAPASPDVLTQFNAISDPAERSSSTTAIAWS
jgi:hypothetical protein